MTHLIELIVTLPERGDTRQEAQRLVRYLPNYRCPLTLCGGEAHSPSYVDELVKELLSRGFEAENIRCGTDLPKRTARFILSSLDRRTTMKAQLEAERGSNDAPRG